MKTIFLLRPNNVRFTTDDAFRGLSTLRDIETIGPNDIFSEFLFQFSSILAYLFLGVP